MTPNVAGEDSVYFFEKNNQDGKVHFVIKPSSTENYNVDDYEKNATANLNTNSGLIVDSSISYDSMSVPSKLMFTDKEYVTLTEWPYFKSVRKSSLDDSFSEKVVKKYGNAKLVRVEKRYADTKLTNIGYYLKLGSLIVRNVDYAPHAVSLERYSFDNNAERKYKDYNGTDVYDYFVPIARGCGDSVEAVTRSDALRDEDLVQVGKSDSGAVVYGLKDLNSELLKKAYDEYAQAADVTKKISLETYIQNHGLVVMKNQSGELLVYVRNQYRLAGGCAKPVVYLYPTTTTNVNVRVGADVKISDPFYPSRGWKNVTAQPSGQLTYQGKNYDSLFWEGQGYGSYPGIVSGTVVKRSDAAATMWRQLVEQGLNQKETEDLMEFWTDKIPNKPYVRLTWLNTRQMDELAPLYISPRPDTVIRVFLDMDGFDQPVTLPAQKLTKIERRGFTVVEWGGLSSWVIR